MPQIFVPYLPHFGKVLPDNSCSFHHRRKKNKTTKLSFPGLCAAVMQLCDQVLPGRRAHTRLCWELSDAGKEAGSVTKAELKWLALSSHWGKGRGLVHQLPDTGRPDSVVSFLSLIHI